MTKRKVVFGHANIQPTPVDSYLMDAFNFNEYDLHFNQQGDLSEFQFNGLRGQRRLKTGFWLLLSVMPIALWFGLLTGEHWVPEYTFIVAVALVACGVMIFQAIWNWTRYGKDMYDDAVAMASGTIELDIGDVGAKGRVEYHMLIAGLTFTLNKEQFLALKNREFYTVYFTTNTQYLLSLQRG